jgi:hypothetical protein
MMPRLHQRGSRQKVWPLYHTGGRPMNSVPVLRRGRRSLGSVTRQSTVRACFKMKWTSRTHSVIADKRPAPGHSEAAAPRRSQDRCNTLALGPFCGAHCARRASLRAMRSRRDELLADSEHSLTLRVSQPARPVRASQVAQLKARASLRARPLRMCSRLSR